jgi:hypothetical protein
MLFPSYSSSRILRTSSGRARGATATTAARERAARERVPASRQRTASRALSVRSGTESAAAAATAAPTTLLGLRRRATWFAFSIASLERYWPVR